LIVDESDYPEGTQKLAEPGEDEPEVVADGGEDGICL
jgi:hypothetical protein